MHGEGSFKPEGVYPEDVLETDGKNRGNVKDIELARIGAEAQESHPEKKDWAGERAMNEELAQRLLEQRKKLGISPESLGDIRDERVFGGKVSRNSELDVSLDHKPKYSGRPQPVHTQYRLDKEFFDGDTAKVIGDVIETGWTKPNAGNIKDLEVARAGAEAEKVVDDKYRKKLSSRLGRFFSKYKNMAEVEELRKYVGERAIEGAVAHKAKSRADSGSTISPRAIQEIGQRTMETQEAVTKQRTKEEAKRASIEEEDYRKRGIYS